MKRLASLFILFSLLAAGMTTAWEQPSPPFCRYYPKKKPFALRFPNLAVCLNAAQPYDEIVGTIEWCRKSYTRVGVDECGRTIQWRATDITYRYVLCNGAYGECFTRTQIDSPVEYVMPVQTDVMTRASSTCKDQTACPGGGPTPPCKNDASGQKVSIFK